MEEFPITQTGEITDFEIHLIEDSESGMGSSALSASMEIKIDDEYFEFGGPSLFLSIPNEGGSDFVGHFIVRCFQTVGASKTREMEGSLIKVKLFEGKISGIASLKDDEFFYPGLEFEELEKGRPETDL